MPAWIDLPLAQPLLDVAGGDDPAEVRLTALETLTYLLLTERTWRGVADRGQEILHELEETSSLGPHAFDVLGRIPVRSMRMTLGAIATNDAREDSLACAMALARQRDPSGLPRIIRALNEQPTEPVAAIVACFPIEQYGVDPAPFHTAMRTGDETVRFWAALALARLGDREAFRRLWRQLPADPPPLFHGDPWTPYHALAQTRPLPKWLQKSIVDAYKRAMARAKKEAGPDAQLPRDQYVLVGGLTGLLDAEGQRIDRPRRGTEPPPEPAPDPDAARRLLDELRAIATRYTVISEDYVSVTNATLDAVLEAGGRVAPPIYEALTDPLILKLPRESLAWTLGRAGARRLLEDTGPIIASAPADRRRELIEITREIASSITADPPYAGAGGSAEEPPPAAGMVVIDDVSTAAKSRDAGSPLPTTTAYPDIGVSNEHPIAGDQLTIDVRLAAAPASGTAGRVVLEGDDPTHVYEIDVTLVFGRTLERSTLRYSVARGTTTPATFTVRAPETGGDARRAMPIRVNFYLNHRWCGEGRRTIEIRRDATVPPGSSEPPPPPDGTDDEPPLHLEDDAVSADLTIRIYSTESADLFVWECTSPHVPIAPPKNAKHAVMKLDDTVKDFVRKHFKPLASKPLADVDVKDIEGVGEILYSSTPRSFKDAYWKVWHASQGLFEFDSVQIVTDEPYVPWELIRIGDDLRGPAVDAELLAVRHSVGRWIHSERARMKQRFDVGAVAVAASDYECVAAVSQKLPWAGKERAFLHDTYGARAVPLTTGDVVEFLEHGCAQVLHFACHGQMFIDDPLSSRLICEDTPQDLKPTMVNRTEVRRGLGRERPLVFLNACEAGAVAAALSLVAGFPGAFLDVGAGAVVSPLWVVNDERARTVSEAFYTEVFANRARPLGQVMRQIRRSWRDNGQLTFLAYVLYGDPLATVSYRR